MISDRYLKYYLQNIGQDIKKSAATTNLLYPKCAPKLIYYLAPTEEIQE